MSELVSPWVARWLPVAPAGDVLDLACGRGRHARLAAGAGHPVLAVDRDPAALLEAEGPGIVTLCIGGGQGIALALEAL